MNRLLFELRKVIHEYFNLEDGRASFKDIKQDIRNNIEFKGSNLWILMFAILIASIGLNVNSTAVVIGAMLISPLMGPIIGVGLGMGTFDFELIKKSASNLAVAIFLSVLVSATYFFLTPIDDAQTELLARTTPTLWDVLIAFFGGMAGIIAVTRSEKSNAIPGVAIATALMPPICTAGYGLAIGNFNYFFGAFYLFFINSVFIAIASMIVVRYLHFPEKEFVDTKKKTKWKTYIAIIAIATAIPSIYLATGIVQRSIFEKNASNFISKELTYEKTFVLQRQINAQDKKIEVYLYGNPLNQNDINLAEGKLKDYSIEEAVLLVHQNSDSLSSVNYNQMRTGIIEDLYRKNDELLLVKDNQINYLEDKVKEYSKYENLGEEISLELEAQYPLITGSAIEKIIIHKKGETNDTTLFVYLNSKRRLSVADRNKVSDWLKVRTKEKSIKIINE